MKTTRAQYDAVRACRAPSEYHTAYADAKSAEDFTHIILNSGMAWMTVWRWDSSGESFAEPVVSAEETEDLEGAWDGVRLLEVLTEMRKRRGGSLASDFLDEWIHNGRLIFVTIDPYARPDA